MKIHLDIFLVMLSILCVHVELKLKLQNISSCVVNFTVLKDAVLEKLKKVEPDFLSSSAKNQVLILLYDSRTNSQNLNKKILKNVIFYLKATTRFDRPLIDF